jgi:hypothetical protein
LNFKKHRLHSTLPAAVRYGYRGILALMLARIAGINADSWDKYGSSLAAVMPFKDWENVAIAYAGIYTLRSWYHKDKTVELDNKGGHVENFNVVLNNVARALPSLEPYLKE